MIDLQKLEQSLNELPLYFYGYVDPKTIEFSDRVRYVCATECPMYNKTWACPPAVGEVAECKCRCLSYENCLMIGTLAEVSSISNMAEGLETRKEHEAITNQVRDLLRDQGVEPYVLSTEACAQCERCAWLDGEPCRHPDKMHPCVESHGINLVPTMEDNGLEFLMGDTIITWYSLLFF